VAHSRSTRLASVLLRNHTQIYYATTVYCVDDLHLHVMHVAQLYETDALMASSPQADNADILQQHHVYESGHFAAACAPVERSTTVALFLLLCTLFQTVFILWWADARRKTKNKSVQTPTELVSIVLHPAMDYSIPKKE